MQAQSGLFPLDTVFVLDLCAKLVLDMFFFRVEELGESGSSHGWDHPEGLQH